MTLHEILLWSRIKKRYPNGPVFRRQYPYAPYVFDFYCARIKLVIEIDGMGHDISDQARKDEARDQYLRLRGFEVLRIAAAEVLADPDDVADGVIRLATERMRQAI
ncbi:endonuclease domain-containing protein [Asticcacaulis sp. MM231]|uniref:endonuclease domain-containing protein n=1 Tax=Asticcacaulis sp. MM231 TaxID=3157666 RepID=UPI0032D57587